MRHYVIAPLLLLVLTDVGAFGQGRSRFIRSPSCPYQDDAVVLEISGLHIADREVPFDEAFVAGDDWLSRLSFRIVNKGTKPIAAIVITVGLLEGVDEELPTHASFDFGMQFVRKHRVAFLMKPGQEIEINSKDSKPYGLRYMDAMLEGTTRSKSWNEFVSKAGARFHRAEVMSADIWFTDRTGGRAELLLKGKCDPKK